MANTRARSFNTLTYNGGKHMLNTKIAMKKRLLHKYKYKLDSPKSSSTNSFYGKRIAQPINSPVEEKSEEEPIDVETVSDTRLTPDISKECANPTESPTSDTVTRDTHSVGSEEEQAVTVPPPCKPSLEQVVARCHLKSSESATEASDNSQRHKSAIESLKDVVNNVSSSGSPTTSDCMEPLPPASTQHAVQQQHGIKRYLSSRAKTVLSDWFRKHLYRPYPTFEEKRELAALCGISPSKVDTWFANKRNRTHNTKKFPPKYSHIF